MSLNNQAIDSQVKAINILNQALNELGLPNVSTVERKVDNVIISEFAKDFNTTQALAILNACGQELCQEYEWQILRRPFEVETVFMDVTGQWQSDSITRKDTFLVDPVTTDFINIFQSGNITDFNALSAPMVDPNDITNITFQAYPYTRVQYVRNPLTINNYRIQFDPQVPYLPNDVGNPAPINNLPTRIRLAKVRFPLPKDYVAMIEGTGWDYTRHFPLIGPTTEQEWAWLVNGFVATAPRIRWSIFNNSVNVYPAYNQGEKLSFIYRSSGWVGTKKIKTDTTLTLPIYDIKINLPDDTIFFNDRLIISMFKYKLYAIKGLDVSILYKDFMRLLDIAKANDGSIRNLSMSPDITNPFISWNNLPDSGYITYSQYTK